MNYYICVTCGIQFDATEKAPDHCRICNEERQYKSPSGQKWTSLSEMIEEGNYVNVIHPEEARLHSIHTTPNFAIGQTAYLIEGNKRNVLWDCVTYLDPASITEIQDYGGIDTIAMSHPHYYSTQVEWAEAFDAIIYIHEDDKQWVTRHSERIQFWSGESIELSDEVKLHRTGGHFKGATVLEWHKGNEENGVLLTGDILRVAADRDWVTFMYSYPNFIPLPAATVSRIAHKVEKMKVDRMYDAFHRIILSGAADKIQKSAKRYVAALEGELFDT